MTKYKFKWKVIDSLNHTTKGVDTIEVEGKLSQEELEEEINAGIGESGFFRGKKLTIITGADNCDVGCQNWKIYGLKEIKDD